MPLTLPNLDDRTFDDLVAEARALIPAYAPDWTNHNESDPGITLVELFAFLSEMFLYRVNWQTEANTRAILQLLQGQDPNRKHDPNMTLTEEIRETVAELRVPYRAVTCADFETLAQAADPENVVRAHCVPRRNLEAGNDPANTDKPGHISVIVLPKHLGTNAQPNPAVLAAVKKSLADRRLITTQVHVVGPSYFSFGVRLTIGLKRDSILYRLLFTVNAQPGTQAQILAALDAGALSPDLSSAFDTQGKIKLSSQITVTVQTKGSFWGIRDDGSFKSYTVRYEQNQARTAKSLNVYEDSARDEIVQALRGFWDPTSGGDDEEGWALGRDVFISEIYSFLDSLPGVDYVTRTRDGGGQPLEELTVRTAEASRLLRKNGYLVALRLNPNELIDIQQLTFDLTVQTQG